MEIIYLLVSVSGHLNPAVGIVQNLAQIHLLGTLERKVLFLFQKVRPSHQLVHGGDA